MTDMKTPLSYHACAERPQTRTPYPAPPQTTCMVHTGTVQGPKEGTFHIFKRAEGLYITNRECMVSLLSSTIYLTLDMIALCSLWHPIGASRKTQPDHPWFQWRTYVFRVTQMASSCRQAFEPQWCKVFCFSFANSDPPSYNKLQ